MYFMTMGTVFSFEIVGDWDLELVSTMTINDGTYTRYAYHMIIVTVNAQRLSRGLDENSSQRGKIH